MSRHPSAENPIDSGLTCARVQRLLWDLVDGTLSLSREQAVRRHLERCAVCRGKWEACLKAERALSSAPTHIPSPGDLLPGFYARLAAQPAPARSGLLALTLKRVALPALAACLLLVGFLGVQLAHEFAPKSAPKMATGLAVDLLGGDLPVPPLLPTRGPAALPKSFIALRTATPETHGKDVAEAQVRKSFSHRQLTRPRLARNWTVSSGRAARNSGAPPSQAPSEIRADRQAADAVSGTKQATEVAMLTAADVGGEQEIHVTDEERGFTHSARVITASDSNDGAPVVSVEADTAQN